MEVKVLKEEGYEFALLGTSLSRNQPPENMPSVCKNLAHKQGGHNKFLEFISVWIDITAPRYFWQQLSTYRAGNSWLSESTMYTLDKKEFSDKDFEYGLGKESLGLLNIVREEVLNKREKIDILKNYLPEGFLQRRIMVTNYKALQNIINQRHDHKLPQWHLFCDSILSQVEHPEFLKQNLNERSQNIE
jgi:thymidylate synthase ThyX